MVDAEGCDVRFESVNFRGHYIRHQNYELWLANETAGSTSLFVQDTTWHWEAPRWRPVDVKYMDVTPSELTALRTSDEDKEDDAYYRSGMVGWYQRPSYDALDDLIFGDTWWVAQTAVNFNLIPVFCKNFSPVFRPHEAGIMPLNPMPCLLITGWASAITSFPDSTMANRTLPYGVLFG